MHPPQTSTPTRRRSVLVAPGADERKARKAIASSADEVVLDLEDAVTSDRKAEARALTRDLVEEFGATRALAVRVNAMSTPWAADDLKALSTLGPALGSVVVPKAESGADMRQADEALGGQTGLQALIETPIGVTAVSEIAGSVPHVRALIIGYADLGALLGRSPSVSPQTWLYVQERVLLAARSNGADAIDGPFLGIADNEPFRHAARWTSELGFDGKWVIHPAQIAATTEIFTPSANGVAYAHRVLDTLAAAEADGRGAAQLDGQMLDEAVAVAARRTLAKIGEQR